MSKTYYFMGGLPRSGNTLLSSIFNQNPNISTTAPSIIADVYNRLHSLRFTEQYISFPDSNSLDNIFSSVLDSYYKDWDSNYIIDRGNTWGTPGNMEMLKKYCPNKIKIICTVRDVLDVLVSYWKLKPIDVMNDIENDKRSGRFYSYKSEQEILCEYLMNPGGTIDRVLFSFYNLIQNYDTTTYHFVEYEDLVLNTRETIEGIYKFLDIELYEHDYDNISQFERNGIVYDDTFFGVEWHKLRSKISLNKNNVRDYFSDKIINKYSNLELWRD